jgi:mannose-6-phosphate isomerase-like protein (cupin superfamily)
MLEIMAQPRSGLDSHADWSILRRHARWANGFDSMLNSGLQAWFMKSNNPCITATVADALKRLPGPKGERFATVFEHGSLVVEIYAPRGVDPQQPHTRDEIYFVASGAGQYICGESRQKFGPADILFAAAGVVHRFEKFSDDLVLWVIFYGPEGGETNGE